MQRLPTCRRLCFIVVCVLLFAGCSALESSDTLICTDELVPGLRVSVEHVEGRTITGEVRIVARDGDYADTSRVNLAERSYGHLAHERPGTYLVTVDKEGYRTWRKSDVSVSADECHVLTRDLTARLTPVDA